MLMLALQRLNWQELCGQSTALNFDDYVTILFFIRKHGREGQSFAGSGWGTAQSIVFRVISESIHYSSSSSSESSI